MQNDDLVRIHHMLDASKEVSLFAKGKTRKDLASDRMLALSIVKDIEIIGEAASKVSLEFRKRHPDIPWQDIIATRKSLDSCLFRHRFEHSLGHGSEGYPITDI
jgi:uncharacterized protein with HEPN domain